MASRIAGVGLTARISRRNASLCASSSSRYNALLSARNSTRRLGPAFNSIIVTQPGLTRSFSLNPWSKKPAEPTTPAPETSLAPSPEVASEVPVSESASAASTSSGLPEGVDANPPIQLLDQSVVDSAVDAAVTAHSTVLQHSDLAAHGLINFWPSGLYNYSLDLTSTLTGLPLGYTIIITAVLWRIALFPMAVKTLRFTSRITRIHPKLSVIQEEMKEAQKARNVVAMSHARTKMMELYKEQGINPLAGLAGPLVQLPVAIGMFLGVKRLCETGLPVLQNSGISWLPDLGVADPTGILPAAFGVSLFWQITSTAQDMDVSARPGMAHAMNMIRFPGAPVIAYFMTSMPCGVLLSLLTIAFATGLQSAILRIPRVKQFFGILPMQRKPGARTSLPSYVDTWNWARSTLSDRWKEAGREALEKQARANKRVGSTGIKRK